MSYSPPWHGQTATDPANVPSEREQPRWVQRSPIANNCPSMFATATGSPSTLIASNCPGATSLTLPTKVIVSPFRPDFLTNPPLDCTATFRNGPRLGYELQIVGASPSYGTELN